MLDQFGQAVHPVTMSKINKVWAGATEPHQDVPSCYSTLASFLLWLQSWSPSKDPVVTFCTDCTRARQAAMVAGGRCHFPNTTFDVDSDGWTRGNRK